MSDFPKAYEGLRFRKKTFFKSLSSFVYRTLSEFWHWFVANVPGDSVDAGTTIFDHLFPLVLPEGNGDHR